MGYGRAILNPKNGHGLRIALWAGLTLSLSGCSFLLVRGPPPDHLALDDFECTEQRGAPSIDVLIAGLGVVVAVGAAATAGDDSDFALAFGVGPGLAVAGLAGWSAHTGFKRVNRCREALQELRERGGAIQRRDRSPTPPPARTNGPMKPSSTSPPPPIRSTTPKADSRG